MILTKRVEDLEVCLSIRVEGFDYLLFVSLVAMKCLSCGEEEQHSEPDPQPVAAKLCAAPH